VVVDEKVNRSTTSALRHLALVIEEREHHRLHDVEEQTAFEVMVVQAAHLDADSRGDGGAA
jgi:hypothetical protein